MLREETFARLLQHFRRWFQVIPLSDLTEGGGKSTKLRCLLTFDDGWRDNFTTAFPLLKRFRMPVVVFLTTGLIDSRETFWVERLRKGWTDPDLQRKMRERFGTHAASESSDSALAEIIENLKHRPSQERAKIISQLLPPASPDSAPAGVDEMMAWEEVLAMSREGIEFGAHTVNHPLLVYESDAELDRELRSSKQAIEERLRTEARAFAYPNGSWDERVRNRVEAAGFCCAFTTQRGWYRQGDDRFAIRRIMLHEGNVTGLGGRFSPAVLSLRLLGCL
jgi:peptidoglycan/xylan/chitin deacetylase (PgdA/CDA1 family)